MFLLLFVAVNASVSYWRTIFFPFREKKNVKFFSQIFSFHCVFVDVIIRFLYVLITLKAHEDDKLKCV